jgi:hypothetical protein
MLLVFRGGKQASTEVLAERFSRMAPCDPPGNVLTHLNILAISMKSQGSSLSVLSLFSQREFIKSRRVESPAIGVSDTVMLQASIQAGTTKMYPTPSPQCFSPTTSIRVTFTLIAT